MVEKYSDRDKHTTGQKAGVADFVKHDCAAAKHEVWENGKKVQKSLVQKKEFNAIKGNENMIAVNALAADKCSLCGMDIKDTAMVPCTNEDVEALSE